MPKKWENIRLAKIKRISGGNSTTNGYDGILRLIFTANIENSTAEVSVFSADYQIDSDLTYQIIRLQTVDTNEESLSIDEGEAGTVAGFIIFRTLDPELIAIKSFYDLVAPPTDGTDSNSDGYYDNPAVYEITDTIPGGAAVTDDYSTSVTSHGTGLLTSSTLSAIPELNSDVQSWLTTFNYPFDTDANRRSADNITIPSGLFKEFDLCVPAGDAPSGDVSGLFYPIWISRIERTDTGGNQLRFYFSTYNVTDPSTGGSPSTVPIEFASLDLLSNYGSDEIVEIIPIDNLLLRTGTDSANWEQGFGRGHVVLSSLWGGTNSEIQDFFDSFGSLDDTTFSQSATRISSFGLSRVPKYAPTVGQSQALLGSSSRLVPSIPPSVDNRYITEADQGLGQTIDLEAQPGITSNPNIDRYGYTGALAHKIVRLVINSENLGSDPTFYQNQVLPRLRILLGRDPQFADGWFNGTRFMWHNGDTWQG